jgi:hypothetical protein
MQEARKALRLTATPRWLARLLVVRWLGPVLEPDRASGGAQCQWILQPPGHTTFCGRWHSSATTDHAGQDLVQRGANLLNRKGFDGCPAFRTDVAKQRGWGVLQASM